MNKIMKETGNEDLRTEFLDLSNLEAVRAFARNIHEKETKVDILINNAGIFCMNKQKTIDHFDGVMQVNHLGPLLLTNLLVDAIRESKDGRIVFVTSSGAFFHNMSVDKLQEPDYFFPHFVSGALHYYNSKLCNMVTSLMFAEELRKLNITSNCLHPGKPLFSKGRDQYLLQITCSCKSSYMNTLIKLLIQLLYYQNQHTRRSIHGAKFYNSVKSRSIF
nr:unnamed protein product [Callosobruchus analis]